MPDPSFLLAMAGGAPSGDQSPLAGFMLPLMIVAIFYFVWLQPVRTKQKRLEDLVKTLKAGDKVIINPGIFGTIVGVEDDALSVRIDEKTKIKVLKTAVAGLQGQPLETENR